MDFSIMGDVLQSARLTGSEAVVPDGIRRIRSHAFTGCRNLRYVKLPAGLTAIGDEAFTGTNLNSLRFPDSVTEVGKNIFYETQTFEIIIFDEDFDVDELKEEYDCFTEADIAEDYGLDPDEPTQAIEAVRFSIASELPVLLLNGQFDGLFMPERTRCKVIVRALKHHPKHDNFLKMVKAHITQIIPYLPGETEIIQYLTDNAVITNDSITECIRIAHEQNAHEVENLLGRVDTNG